MSSAYGEQIYEITYLGNESVELMTTAQLIEALPLGCIKAIELVGRLSDIEPGKTP